MDFFSRKLLSDNDDDDDDLKELCNRCLYRLPDHCPSDCLEKCSKPCSISFSIPPITSDEFNPSPPSKSPPKLSNLVTVTIALLSFIFLLVLCYAVYARFYSGRRPRRRRLPTPPPPPPPPTTTHHHEFLDEEHGPDLDHPIWYIRTIGLPPAVIDAIAVCKFKSGEGLIDGTECSVCLSEFEEDETLRLLPKCSHAFHLPCIDTWLRSHTNCPMCRAPVAAQSTAVTPSTLPPPRTAASEETQMRNSQREVGDTENVGESSVRNEEEEEEDEIDLAVDDSEERVSDIQPTRRSVSLDSLSALGISSVFDVVNEKMDCEDEGKKSSNCSAAASAMNRSVSCSGKFLMRSSTQRSSGANQS